MTVARKAQLESCERMRPGLLRVRLRPRCLSTLGLCFLVSKTGQGVMFNLVSSYPRFVSISTSKYQDSTLFDVRILARQFGKAKALWRIVTCPPLLLGCSGFGLAKNATVPKQRFRTRTTSEPASMQRQA